MYGHSDVFVVLFIGFTLAVFTEWILNKVYLLIEGRLSRIMSRNIRRVSHQVCVEVQESVS